MFKKNCLALLSLGLFSSFANASAYSDKLAEMQAKFPTLETQIEKKASTDRQ